MTKRRARAKSSTEVDSGFFNRVQKVGNYLPDPFCLFVMIALFIAVMSYWFEGRYVEVSTVSDTGAIIKEQIAIRNLLSPDYLRSFLTNFTKTYVTFAPLGLVMVTLLAVGYVKESGFFTDTMYNLCKIVPKYLVTFCVVVMACAADMASNAGIIISTTVASAVFWSIKRNPIVGAVVGYAAAHAAEPTNILLTGFMVMMSSITQTAIDAANIQVTVTPLANYYFLAIAFFVLAIAITIVVEVVFPKLIQVDLNEYEYKRMSKCDGNEKLDISDESVFKDAIIATAIGILAYICLIGLGLRSGGLLRGSNDQIVPDSPFIVGIVPLLIGLFFVIGTIYGCATRRINRVKDIPKMMESGIHDAANYLVVCFPAAFAIKFFGDSNLTQVISVVGAKWLADSGMSQFWMLIGLMIIVMILNLFITSGSAKWLIFAPIVVPMFYQLDIPPDWTQMAYVIADTATDPISLISYYFPLVITIWEKYKHPNEEIGIGNVYSLTLPIALTVTGCLITQFAIWWILKLPLGV